MDKSLVITLILVALFAVVFVVRKASQYDIGKAKEDLKSGAVLIDVRSEGEYIGGNVAGAINIPLDRIVRGVESRFPEKSQKLLCYCERGGRSGLAVSKLRAAGYENVHSLGSLNRAHTVLD